MAHEKLQRYFECQIQSRRANEEARLQKKISRFQETAAAAEELLAPHMGLIGGLFALELEEDSVVLRAVGVDDSELFFMEGLLIKEAKEGVTEEQRRSAQRLLGTGAFKPRFFTSSYGDRGEIGWAQLVCPCLKKKEEVS